MANLILNRTAALASTINALVEHQVRISHSLDDVIVTPIAGTWSNGVSGCGNLPYYGFGYMSCISVGLAAQVRVSEFGHVCVLYGTQDQLRFPNHPGIDVVRREDFTDPLKAADLIVAWLDGSISVEEPKPISQTPPERQVLVAAYTVWEDVISQLDHMSNHGLSDRNHEHCQDMFEYLPHVKDHKRTLDVYLCDGGDVVIKMYAYGVYFEHRFIPTKELTATLNGDV